MPVHTGRRANTSPMPKSCACVPLNKLLTRFCGQHRQIHHRLVQLPRHPTPGIPQIAHRPQAGELGGGAQLLRGFDQQLGICRRCDVLQETRVPLRFDVAAGAEVVGALPDVAPGSEDGFFDMSSNMATSVRVRPVFSKYVLKARTVTRRRSWRRAIPIRAFVLPSSKGLTAEQQSSNCFGVEKAHVGSCSRQTSQPVREGYNLSLRETLQLQTSERTSGVVSSAPRSEYMLNVPAYSGISRSPRNCASRKKTL
jgi:hypothetical protein